METPETPSNLSAADSTRLLRLAALAVGAWESSLRVEHRESERETLGHWSSDDLDSDHPRVGGWITTRTSPPGAAWTAALSVRVSNPRGWTEAQQELLDDFAARLTRLVRQSTERPEEDLAALQWSRLVAAVDSLHAGILVEDDTRHIHFVNEVFCSTFGIPARPSDLIGSDCSGAAAQTMHLFADPEGFRDRIDELLSGRVASRDERVEMADGRILERDYVPIFVGATYRGHVWSYRDVSERERSRAQLERQASQLRELSLRDPLTGLTNRRGFLTIACQQLRACQRSGAPATLVFLDLDGLKSINDAIGHAAGDAAICRAAEVLRTTLRESDILARLGGDEFVALLPDTTEAGAALCVERIDAACEAINDSAGLPYRLSISAGVARAETGEGVEALLGRADASMYSAKRKGGVRRSVLRRVLDAREMRPGLPRRRAAPGLQPGSK